MDVRGACIQLNIACWMACDAHMRVAGTKDWSSLWSFYCCWHIKAAGWDSAFLVHPFLHLIEGPLSAHSTIGSPERSVKNIRNMTRCVRRAKVVKNPPISCDFKAKHPHSSALISHMLRFGLACRERGGCRKRMYIYIRTSLRTLFSSMKCHWCLCSLMWNQCWSGHKKEETGNCILPFLLPSPVLLARRDSWTGPTVRVRLSLSWYPYMGSWQDGWTRRGDRRY